MTRSYAYFPRNLCHVDQTNKLFYALSCVAATINGDAHESRQMAAASSQQVFEPGKHIGPRRQQDDEQAFEAPGQRHKLGHCCKSCWRW